MPSFARRCLVSGLALLPFLALASGGPDPKTQGLLAFSTPKSLRREVVELKSVETGKTYDFLPGTVGKDGGPVASLGWLPAGRYVLARWGASIIPARDDAQGADATAVITVEPGRLTDGGTLLAFPVGQQKIVVVPVRLAETAAAVDAVRQANAASLSDAEAIVWHPSKPYPPADVPASSPLGGVIPLLLAQYEAHVNQATPHERLLEASTAEAFFALAKAATPPLMSQAVPGAMGRALYGADYGQVRVREQDGNWRTIDTGTLQRVTSLAVDGDHLVAGYDDGTLRTSADAGATWSVLPAPAPARRVMGIAHLGGRWFVLSAHVSAGGAPMMQVDHASLFATAADDLQGLAPLREFDIEPTFQTPHLEAAGHALYLNAGSSLWRFDTQGDTWKSLPLPGAGADFHLGNEGVVAAWRVGGMFSTKLYVSKDDGATWKTIDHPSNYINDIRMFDVGNGVATRADPQAFSVVQEIYTYDAAGDAWKLQVEAPAGCVRLLIDAANRPRHCVTSGGSILALDDVTKKWSVEYSTE